MARQQRPGRTLVVFFALVALSYGLVALAGSWQPKLGLDLQGGTRINLIAKGDVTEASLQEAAAIIDQRVNGSGVSEAEVTVQGSRFVVVEIPGQSRRDLVDVVKRQAQMRFRVVARVGNGQPTPTDASPSAGSNAGPSAPAGQGVLAPTPTPTAPTPATGSASPDAGEASGSPAPSASPNNRPAVPAASATPGAKKPKKSPGANPSESPTSPTASPTDGSSAPAGEETKSPSIDQPLAWSKNPDAKSVAAFDKFTCPVPGDAEAEPVDDNPEKPLVTCDDQGAKYLLSRSMIEGTELKTASAGQLQNDIAWVVNLSFDSSGTKVFADISKDLLGTERQFAVVLDGQVISAPTMDGLITNGEAYIRGNFTQESAQSLATSLKFGALPVAFEKDPPVETVGPSLAGNQLQAGLLAGAIGLLAVMFYCLLYYRGLGFVVISSLMVAAALTYSLVLLLSQGAGFTLSLPGIAGLIVAVGITADSFIVFFERIRDEMRDGKSMRVAVEHGWVRARNTCLAADTVSLLAAVVLYIAAAGVVKGFAFALGLSTIIDLIVFFWFTKPLVSWLAGYRFFNQGHPMSGLGRETLGLDPVAPATAGGKL